MQCKEMIRYNSRVEKKMEILLRIIFKPVIRRDAINFQESVKDLGLIVDGSLRFRVHVLCLI